MSGRKGQDTGYREFDMQNAVVENTYADSRADGCGQAASFRRPAGLRRRQTGAVALGAARLLLENVLRCTHGAEREAAGVRASGLAAHRQQRSRDRVPARPRADARHHQHAGAGGHRRDARRAGRSRRRPVPCCNPTLPVDVSVDHSLAVEAYAAPTPPALTCSTSCAATPSATDSCAGPRTALHGRAHPSARHRDHAHHQPGAAGDRGDDRDARWSTLWAVPDMMIGTDSHTPMVNGIGVLGWGVGGLEAQTRDVRHADHAAHPRRDRRAAHRRAAAPACSRPIWR